MSRCCASATRSCDFHGLVSCDFHWTCVSCDLHRLTRVIGLGPRHAHHADSSTSAARNPATKRTCRPLPPLQQQQQQPTRLLSLPWPSQLLVWVKPQTSSPKPPTTNPKPQVGSGHSHGASPGGGAAGGRAQHHGHCCVGRHVQATPTAHEGEPPITQRARA